MLRGEIEIPKIPEEKPEKTKPVKEDKVNNHDRL